MLFHWSLSDSKSPQVSWTLLSILADFFLFLVDLNNTVVWMVSTRPVISKSSSPCINPLVTVPRAPITIGIIFTSSSTVFFNSQTKSMYFFFALSFNFTLWSARTAKYTIQQVLFLLLIIISSDRLAAIRWSVCISKSQRGLCVSFSRTDTGLCIYNLFAWSNFNPSHNYYHHYYYLLLEGDKSKKLYQT